MTSLDTNVAVRLVLDDDPAQCKGEIVGRALTAFEAGPADFSDYLILETSREAGALPVFTFDERFARARGVELVPAD